MEINQPFETNYWIELLLDRFFEPTKPEHMKALSDISREESVPGDNLNFFFKKVMYYHSYCPLCFNIAFF